MPSYGGGCPPPVCVGLLRHLAGVSQLCRLIAGLFHCLIHLLRQRLVTLANLPVVFLGKDLFSTGFQWMKAAFPGFRDEQVKPYTFSPAPFCSTHWSSDWQGAGP